MDKNKITPEIIAHLANLRMFALAASPHSPVTLAINALDNADLFAEIDEVEFEREHEPRPEPKQRRRLGSGGAR